MCSRALLAGYLIIAGISAARLTAQSPGLLRDRLDREVAQATRAKAALEKYVLDKIRARVLPDTLVIAGGNIRIVTEPRIAALVKEAAGRADSNLREVLEALPILAGSVIEVRYDTTSRALPDDGPQASLSLSTPPQRGSRHALSALEADAIAYSIEELTINQTIDRVKNPFFHWRRSSSLPLRAADRNRETDWSAVRYDLLASRSLLGPRCYNGEIAACSMQLGLTTTDDPVMSWYDSLARIDEVKLNRARALRNNRVDTEKCLQGDDIACGRALQSIDVLVLPPAGGISRDAIVREAIKLGGDGAVQRIVSSRGTASEALAAAANVPVDSVLKVWQRKLRQNSIGSDDLSAKLGIVAVGWIALLLGLSTRISRWR